jgi:hypothetical protein
MRISVPNPFGPLQAQLSEAQILKLYLIMRNSTGLYSPENVYAAKKALADHYLRFGLSIVGEWPIGAKYPRMIPELISEMAWQLWYSLGLLSDGAIDHHGVEPNVPAYIAVTIRRHLLRHLRKSFRHQRRFGESSNKIAGRMDASMIRIDFFETLYSCTENPKERTIIERRLMGFSDQDIAPLLGLTKQRVGQIKRDIERRFLEKLNNDPYSTREIASSGGD